MTDDGQEDRFDRCETILGHRFANRTFLETALTHASLRTPARESNERMEFLGDAILGLAISEYLYERLPQAPEGELTRIKSVVVSRATLARRAQALGLASIVATGKGVAKREKLPTSILANVFEALVAALQFDAGPEVARKFVLDQLAGEVDRVLENRHRWNWKSLLQQHTQKEKGITPVYTVIEEEGPDHAKRFRMLVRIDGEEFGVGHGPSKKDAEQAAARETLRKLGLADE